MDSESESPDQQKASLECHSLGVSAGDRQLVEDLSLSIAPGTFVCILGCNGSGKTLTLHTLAGLRDPTAGSVTVDGRNIGDYPRQSLSRRLGLMLQVHEDGFPLTVAETALMGRHPWLEFWQWDAGEDRELVARVLEQVDLTGLDERQASSLSGGERQRLALATLLVQGPDILLLDEPLNHLDPAHRLIVMQILSRLASDGRTVIASIHDPTLVSRHADRVLMLDGDGGWAFGDTDTLLTTDRLEALYGVGFRRYDADDVSVLLPDYSLTGNAPQ